MGFTTVVRLAAGLLTFSVLARLLGPEAFGVLMLWFSVATLLALVTNFGLVPYVLREIGANPATAEDVINEGITIKLLLTTLVFACTAVGACLATMDHEWVLLALLAAAVTDSFIEFLNAGFRARNRFDIETRIATITSLAHAAIVAGLVFLSPTIEVAAAAYLASRLLALALTVPAVARHFAVPKLAGLAPSLKRFRRVVVYAVDFGFQSLFGNIDSVVINHFVGPAAVGIYQAGMRVFQGGAVAVQVLANVFLPRAAALADNPSGFGQESQRLQMAFLSFGALFGIGMAIFAGPIVFVLFGSAYNELIQVFSLFGLLFFVRFSAAAWGVVLTAAGEQRFRTVATATHWVLIAIMVPILLPRMGLAGWLLSLVIGTVLLGILYAMRGARRLTAPWKTAAMTAIGGSAFLPFLHVFP